ncbi:SAM-dependent methyltransferase [Alteribacter lacisalsi]|uniref:SAM-dependent methyltransferase n=1 Tax=Alteribacter lacisalsi TaxID=2045244 RepID=A0A2W0HSK9_9BACI|nr:class I SAM-dependent methyltransferase [Alteribacter lacisalsi]PYZ96578.1 SAM-dependent methyltransferase [Alteribacter lacisalsi]
MDWKAYNDLAWLEPIIAPAEEYREEAERYIEAITAKLARKAPGKPAMLHLGCGAGGHDAHFKHHFRVTGVDVSPGQLEIAAGRNPEVDYKPGDMRTFDLDRRFDVVAIPDSIMYMTTKEDLKAVLADGARHLAPGGVLFFVVHTKEEFQNNNFVYTAEEDGGQLHVTVFENNHILPGGDSYEAAMVFLIRENAQLRIEHDVHTLGLFNLDTWMNALKEEGFTADVKNADDLYDHALMENGEYKLKMFTCTKK